jgi:MFS family permease
MQQGLQRNINQFLLLVLVNAFVGAMVGLERSVMPEYAAERFHVNSNTALLSFIAAFGFTKAVFNFLTGSFHQCYNRKQVLLAGWVAAIPVPFLLMYAPSWAWVIAANILLGINQGLTWSSTVTMKVDLVGAKDRGLAMGINEFAGYIAVGLSGYFATVLAHQYGAGFYPFVPGIVFAFAGLFLSWIWVKDTTAFVHHEQQLTTTQHLAMLWKQVSYKHHNLGSTTINGFINNLNDGVIWGLLPVWLLSQQFSIAQAGAMAAVYPAVWGISQLFAGKLGDHYCKKQLITIGMLLQAAGIFIPVFFTDSFFITTAMALMGLGTGLVYPNFLTVIAENLTPVQRSKGVSIFRFWRDMGYVAGALLAGLLADWLGIITVFLIVALITGAGALLANIRMCCTYKLLWRSHTCSEAAAF